MDDETAVRGVARHLLDELACEGPSTRFWDTYWRLAQWISLDERAIIQRAIGRREHAGPTARPRLMFRGTLLHSAGHQYRSRHSPAA